MSIAHRASQRSPVNTRILSSYINTLNISSETLRAKNKKAKESALRSALASPDPMQQTMEYPPVCHGNRTHSEQGHYKANDCKHLHTQSAKEKQRTRRMWRNNRGCQYQSTGKFTSQSAERAATTLAARTAQKRRPATAAISRPKLDLQRIGECERTPSAWGERANQWAYSTYGQQQQQQQQGARDSGGSGFVIRVRAQAGGGARRPQSALESRGRGGASGVGFNHVGCLDKTSMLRMKVNLAFTQPTIPPPTPMLTGKAGTARNRNIEIERPEEISVVI